MTPQGTSLGSSLWHGPVTAATHELELSVVYMPHDLILEDFSHPSRENQKKSRNFKWQTSRETIKIFYTRTYTISSKTILLHFSSDAERWLQIKSIWIWNVNLHKTDFCYNLTAKQYLKVKPTVHQIILQTCVQYIWNSHFHRSVHLYYWLIKSMLLIPTGWNIANFGVRFLLYTVYRKSNNNKRTKNKKKKKISILSL